MKTKIAKWLLLQIMLIFSQDLLAGPVCRCGAVMVWVQERGGYLCEACNNAFIPGYQGASAEVSQIEVVQEEEQEEEVVQKKVEQEENQSVICMICLIRFCQMPRGEDQTSISGQIHLACCNNAICQSCLEIWLSEHNSNCPGCHKNFMVGQRCKVPMCQTMTTHDCASDRFQHRAERQRRVRTVHPAGRYPVSRARSASLEPSPAHLCSHGGANSHCICPFVCCSKEFNSRQQVVDHIRTAHSPVISYGFSEGMGLSSWATPDAAVGTLLSAPVSMEDYLIDAIVRMHLGGGVQGAEADADGDPTGDMVGGAGFQCPYCEYRAELLDEIIRHSDSCVYRLSGQR